MKKFFYILSFIVLFVLAPAFVQTIIAQPPPPPPQEIPIDGGLGFLLAAGVGYAAKKLHSSQKKDKNPPV